MACNCGCSPMIKTNQDRYKALGGQLVGCCGNAAHTYGFHCAACAVPSSDYSIRRSTGVANASWACAGDFSMNLSWSRRWVAWLVTEVKAGRFPEIVEIIGSVDGQTALYWARWEGWVARKYTGGGHVAWAHISCDRAKAALTSDWLKGWPSTVSVPPEVDWRTPLFVALGTLANGANGWAVRKVQATVKVHTGLALSEDGDYGSKTTSAVRKFQALRGLPVTGAVDADDWRALASGAPTISRGAKGLPVGEVQAMLNLWGAGLKEDQDFGGATQRALTNFQTKYRLAGGADGIAGPATWTYLLGS
jgi:Putative peptidoglycan binding domain